MPNAPTDSAHQQTVERHGTAVELINYNENEDSDYGPNPTQTAESPHSILARAWTASGSQIDSDNRDSADIEIDRYVLIKDNASGADNITEGGGRGASVVKEGGSDYYVVFKNKFDNGTIRLECRRKS